MAKAIRLGRSLRRAQRRHAEHARLETLLKEERRRFTVHFVASRATLDIDCRPWLRFHRGADQQILSLYPQDCIVLRDFLNKHFPPGGE